MIRDAVMMFIGGAIVYCYPIVGKIAAAKIAELKDRLGKD